MHSTAMDSPTGFSKGEAKVQIYRSSESLASAAAHHAAQLIRAAIESNGRARIMAATGNSQIAFVTALTKESLQWNLVEAVSHGRVRRHLRPSSCKLPSLDS